MKLLLFAALAVAGAAVAGVVANAGSSKATIRVTEREYKISLSTKQAQSGRVRFEIKNTGKYPHSLSIAGAGVKAKTKLIQPGKSAVLRVDLEHGSYALWCAVPGHAARGMKAALAVLGASNGGGGGAATTSGAGDTSTASGVPWG